MVKDERLSRADWMEPAKKTRKINPMWIVMAAGLVAFIVYFVFYVDIDQVAQTISQTNLAIYSLAFVSYLMFTFCSALVWRSLLGSLAVKITRRKAFLYTWVGLFFDATVPQLGWSAEISKTYLFSKDSQTETGRVGASVVGQKIFTMTITVGALSAGLLLLLIRYSLPLSIALLIGLILGLSIITLGLVYYVSLKATATKTLLQWAVRVAKFFRKSWNPQSFTEKAQEMLGRFHGGMEQLRANPRGLIAPIIYAVLGFAFEVSIMFLAFAALGQPVPVDVVLIVFALTGTLQTVGATFVGFPELIMTVTLQALSINPAVALSVALLTRVVNLWFRLGLSYGALQLAGIKILRQNPAD
jgi:uncharacterized protein (TIRG00374 family)